LRYFSYLFGAIMQLETDLLIDQQPELTECLQFLEEVMLEICESSHNDRQDYYQSDPQY
jgi:hypothetical protein